MSYVPDATQLLLEPTVTAFFRNCHGDWRSERRYYTIKSGETQEVVSDISIRFLDRESPELQQLAALHGLPDTMPLLCGTQVTWESTYVKKAARKPASGSTVFGVRGDILYRDRGFATPKPVTADFYFRDQHTMVLKTAYDNSSFEEEIRLIGDRTRTRQTIISRAGEEQVIGQYLEQRC
ncbi:MAG: phycobiliprotein lyase [Leptolyngbya sp. RL_3_1]|nr:phycobiliprotein lyase [Leptolyngbya sp. RL_3_1]